MKTVAKWLYGCLSHMVLIVGWLWAYYIFRIKNKVEIIGRENIPHSTNALFLSNHQTLIDSFLIGLVTVSFWETLFHPERIPWNAPDRTNFLTHRVWKHLFQLLKNVPVERKITNLETINHQVELFCEALTGSNLLLFFEGTRTRNGDIGECRPGVSETIRLAKPRFVVPILLEDIQVIMPIEVGFSYKGISGGHKGRIVIGQPIDFSDLDMSGRVRKEIGHRVRQAVIDLKTHRQ